MRFLEDALLVQSLKMQKWYWKIKMDDKKMILFFAFEQKNAKKYKDKSTLSKNNPSHISHIDYKKVHKPVRR